MERHCESGLSWVQDCALQLRLLLQRQGSPFPWRRARTQARAQQKLPSQSRLQDSGCFGDVQAVASVCCAVLRQRCSVLSHAGPIGCPRHPFVVHLSSCVAHRCFTSCTFPRHKPCDGFFGAPPTTPPWQATAWTSRAYSPCLQAVTLATTLPSQTNLVHIPPRLAVSAGPFAHPLLERPSAAAPLMSDIL